LEVAASIKLTGSRVKVLVGTSERPVGVSFYGSL